MKTSTFWRYLRSAMMIVTVTLISNWSLAQLTSNSSATAILCNGGTSTVTVSATGGTPPYSGTGNFTVNAGPYSYTVTDANGGSSVTTGTVSEPTQLAAAIAGPPTGPCLGANSTVNGDFQTYTGSISSTNTFINNNVANWNISHGTPSTIGNLGIWMWSYLGYGEGIYTGHNFVAGQEYQLTYEISQSTDANPISQFVVRMNNGMNPNASTTIPSTAGTQVVSNIGWSLSGGVQTITETFTAGANYSQLWFYPYLTGNATPNQAACWIDNIVIEQVIPCASTGILCNGGTTDVTVSAIGGTEPYTGIGIFNVGAGTHSYTVTDANNCSEVVTVSITEPTQITGTDVQSACGTYFWIDGNTYTASTNTPTFTILGGAANGCDSTVTLDLTITVADPVLNVASTNITTTSAEITWDAMSLPVTGSFAIEYREVGTLPWLSGTFATSVNTSAVITGLTAATNYEARVTASCSTGQPGTPSASHPFTTAGATCMDAMVLSQVSNSGNSVTLTWVPVPTIGWYEFRYKESSSAVWLSGGTINSVATSKMIFGLNPSTSYDFEGRRFCPAAAPWSATLTITTDPLTGCNTPPALTASTVTGSVATITWAAVTGAGWYQFRYKEITSSTWNSGGSAGGSSTSKSITGLNPGTAYNFEGRTNCPNGTYSPWGATMFSTTANGGCELPPVLDPVPLASTTSSITISWPAVTGAAWYTFQYKESVSSTWLSSGSASGSATSKTYVGLTPFTQYDFQAKSYCPTGAGSAWSATGVYSTGIPLVAALVDNTPNDKATVLIEKALDATNHETNVYPNPVTEKVNVEIYMESASDNSALRLLDMNGRLVKEISLQTVEGLNILTMDLQGISGGLYTMHIYQNGNLMHTAKVKKK